MSYECSHRVANIIPERSNLYFLRKMQRKFYTWTLCVIYIQIQVLGKHEVEAQYM